MNFKRIPFSFLICLLVLINAQSICQCDRSSNEKKTENDFEKNCQCVCDEMSSSFLNAKSGEFVHVDRNFPTSNSEIEQFQISMNFGKSDMNDGKVGFLISDAQENSILKFQLFENKFEICSKNENHECFVKNLETIKNNTMKIDLFINPISSNFELRIDGIVVSIGNVQILNNLKFIRFINDNTKNMNEKAFQFSNLKFCYQSQPKHFLAKRQCTNTVTTFGTGIGNATEYGLVHCIAFFRNEMYIGGDFLQAGGVLAYNLARWNNVNWFSLKNGTNNEVFTMAVFQNELYIGGEFSMAGSVNSMFLVKWNGSEFFAIPNARFYGGSTISRILYFKIFNSILHIGGYFSLNVTNPISGFDIVHFALWNGSKFSTYGGAFGGEVRTFEYFKSDLYVAGYFYSIGSVLAKFITKWNGTSWLPIGSGADDLIFAMTSDANFLYIGGYVKNISDVSVTRIAKFNGQIWSPLGSGVNNYVSTLAVVGSDLFLGGQFVQAGGQTALFIAKWNGLNFTAIGAYGFDNQVLTFVTNSTDLYVGGAFTTLNSVSGVNRILKFPTCSPPATPIPTPIPTPTTPIPTPIPTPEPTPIPTPIPTTQPTPPTPIPQPTPIQTTPPTPISLPEGTGNSFVSSHSNSNSTGIIVGIVLGLIFVLICIVVLVLFFVVRRRKQQQRENQKDDIQMKQEATTEQQQQANQYSEKSPYAPLSAVSSSKTDHQYKSLGSIPQSYTPNDSQYVSPNLAKSMNQKEAYALFKKFAIPYSDLNLEKELGKGNFGSVFLVHRISDPNQQIACKQLTNSPANDTNASTASDAFRKETKAFKDFVAEAKILESIPPSPYVVKFIGLCSEPFCILTEFIDGGSLLEYLTNPNPDFTFNVAIGFLKQICKGIAHLHKNGIIHRDLAARNVLLRTKIDEETQVRQCVLVDMGLARLFETGENYLKTRSPIPLKWTAPEALRDKKFSEKSDMYSFGILTIECLTRTIPFPNMSALECAMAISSGRLIPTVSGKCPDNLVPIFDPCFLLNPDQRPSASQLLQSIDKIAQ